MTVGNALNLSVTGVVTQAAAGTFSGSATTEYAVQVGGANNTLSSLASLGSSGEVLTSQGAGQPPIFAAAAGGGDGWVFLASATASSSATLDFTSSIDSTYNLYAFVLDQIIPATDNTSLNLRTSANAGSSWDSGASDYYYSTAATTIWNSDSNSTAAWWPTNINSLGNGANETANGIVYLYNPSASSFAMLQAYGISHNAIPRMNTSYGAGMRRSAAAVNGIRFFLSSGNIASGTIKLYGCCKPS